jgi:hypothetical protein
VVIEMHLPIDAFNDRKMPEVRAIQAALVAWARETAPTLPARKYADYRGTLVSAQPPGVPFSVSLVRFDGITAMPGYVQLMRNALRKAGEAWDSRDYTTAMKWYLEPAEIGEPVAQYRVGWMYGNGKGAPLDYRTAMMWYRKSADQNYTLAQDAIAYLYWSGHGVAKDPTVAATWLRNAADRNDAIAEYGLGIMYGNGEGVPQDLEEAGRWMTKAANGGNSQAQFQLGKMYLDGDGVQQDTEVGMEWARNQIKMRKLFFGTSAMLRAVPGQTRCCHRSPRVILPTPAAQPMTKS